VKYEGFNGPAKVTVRGADAAEICLNGQGFLVHTELVGGSRARQPSGRTQIAAAAVERDADLRTVSVVPFV
jgi:hypothetical protein